MIEVKNGNVIITLPLEEGKMSASGKSKVIASTHGNVKMPVKVNGATELITISANVFQKA